MREKRGARDVENCRSDFAMSFTILVRPSLAQPSRRGLNVSRRNFFLTFIKREYRLDDWPAGRPTDRESDVANLPIVLFFHGDLLMPRALTTVKRRPYTVRRCRV